MAAKKKTVKELSDMVENLVEKIKHLEEKVKKMSYLEEKIKHLEENVKRSNKGFESFKSNEVQKSIKCSKCNCIFETKRLLRNHMKDKHSDINCDTCGITFDEQWKYEKHLAKEHDKEKTFDCETCDESFFTKWRLKKHERSHDEPNIKFCHYYNNFKKCPYKEIGCKFRHVESEQCKYQKECKNRLCQFRHQRDSTTWKCKEINWEGKSCQFKTMIELRMKNHMLGGHGIGNSFQCDHCEYQDCDRGLLRKHVEKDHAQKYETCGRNCSDRLYEDNTFKCINCETTQCIVCSQSENSEICWGCENLLRGE